MIKPVIIGILAYFFFTKDSKKITPPKPPVINPKDIWDEDIKKVAEYYGFDWKILKALIGVESNYGQSDAVINRIVRNGGKRGILGITDIEFQTVNLVFKNEYKPDDLWTPRTSIQFGGYLLNFHLTFWNKNLEKAIKSYHIGHVNLSLGKYLDMATEYWQRFQTEYLTL